MRGLIKRVLALFTSIKRHLKDDWGRHPYLIEEIDMSSRLVFLRCVGSRMVVKFKIEQFVSDISLVDKLPAKQSCVLGGCYGRILRAAMEGRDALNKVKKMNFLLSNKRGRYKIVFQNRNGDIGYYDQKTRQEFVEHPLTIVNNDYIISEFDPSQACYIGILAGISLEKAVSSGKSGDEIEVILNKPPKLRIVE